MKIEDMISKLRWMCSYCVADTKTIEEIDMIYDTVEAAVNALHALQKEFPPFCFRDNNGECDYLVYGDDNDEPIDKCKECPLCQSDKLRHSEATRDKSLNIEKLKKMNGKTVWYFEQHAGNGCWEKYIVENRYDAFYDEVVPFGVDKYGNKVKLIDLVELGVYPEPFNR